MNQERHWPKITIVTPNYNQAEYLEQSIISVLDQHYPNLEYIVIDDGSTDGSPEVIKKYSDRLAYWTTRPNKGQYATINEGFARSTGEIMAWINSDDMYLPGAFSVVAEIFSQHPQVEWLTTVTPVLWNEHSHATLNLRLPGFNRQAFFHGANFFGDVVYSKGCIQQESTFWRRSLWQRAGACLDESFKIAADFELWARFYQYGELYGVCALLGGFRQRAGQNTDRYFSQYVIESDAVLQKYGGKRYGPLGIRLRGRMLAPMAPFLKWLPRAVSSKFLYPVKIWQHSGRGGEWILKTELIA